MKYFLLRTRLAIGLLPARAGRLFRQLKRVCIYRPGWWLDTAFLLLDLLFFFDLYELLSNLLAPRTRPLHSREIRLLQSVFGHGLPYDLIRIDERARLGPPQGRFCYVSFHTINSWGEMTDVTLVHEAVHVWQYARVGAAYIPRALAAQRTGAGYDYGGAARLAEFSDFSYFNYEQQADIVADAYALSAGFQPRWTARNEAQFHCFLPFLEQLQAGELPAGYRFLSGHAQRKE